jgi:uncharacterized protein YuzE
MSSFTMTFDPEIGVSYIYNRGRQSQAGVVGKTVEVRGHDNVYLDYDKDGKIFGIEILSPGKITLLEALRLLEPTKKAC